MPELKKGSHGTEVFRFYDYFKRYSASYAFLLGNRDGYYGDDEAKFTSELQFRLGVPRTGRFGDLEASLTGYRWGGTTAPPVVIDHRKIWLYSNPGSGVNEFVGPSFDLGERAKSVLHINHVPVHSEIGGYLGFMGGDPTFSYVDVTWDQYHAIARVLADNPDINDPDLELWFSGYSQKADGLEDALEILFGDGGFIHPGDPTQTPSPPGPYRHLRGRINGVIQFGNPSTKTTGIARKVRPAWLYALVHNINKPNDFYAIAPDAIRPTFYAIIIKAEMELPFFIHVLKVAVPVMLGYVPIFGGLLGPLAVPMVAAMAGLNSLLPLLSGLMGQAGSAGDEEVDKKLEEMLSAKGLVENALPLIQLVGALPGLQAHGMYDQNDNERAYQIMAGFRR